ncbi:hypothetical protein ACLMJK_003934 [Lecanora helva]
MEAYAYSTSAWLTLQSIPLFLSPKLLITLLSPEARLPTDLETYLSTTLSLTLLTLSALTILHSGALPLTSPALEREDHSPYAYPTTLVTTTYHILSTIVMYIQYGRLGSVGFGLGMVGSGALTCWGIWCLVFGGSGEAGGKERVSGWPFRNEEERRIKREKMGGRKRL